MTLEWVVTLQQHTERAERKILALAEGYQVLDDGREAETLGRLVERLQTISLWVQVLPHDDTFWLTVDSITLLKLAELQSSRLRFEALLALRKKVFLITPDPLEPAIQSIRDDFDAADQTKFSIKRPLSNPARQRSSRVIIQELYLRIYPWYTKQPLDPTLLLDERPVFYGMFVQSMLSTLMVTIFDRSAESAQITVQRTPSCFEIMLTNPTLHLRPDLWNTLMARIALELEDLRENGGEVAALTWNTGLGEGVIVKLPWAKTS